MRCFKPCKSHNVPVLWFPCRKHCQDGGDDAIAPSPERPPIEELHVVTAIGKDGHIGVEDMWNKQTQSEPEKEAGTVSLESTSVEVTILPVCLQW